MKYFLISICSVLLFSSCVNKNLFYKFSISHPVKSQMLFIENDTFSINFEIGAQEINFVIFNKSLDGIRVNWDEVSFSINGEAQRVIHKNTGVFSITNVQPPTTIPPKSTLTDFLLPTSAVRYLNISNSTYTIFKSMLPTYANGKKNISNAIKSLKGTKITVFLPLYIGNKYQSYYYDIMIDDIIPIDAPSNLINTNHTEGSTKRNWSA